jgi:predicted lipoprotein with Yx(FWY)xxD motif
MSRSLAVPTVVLALGSALALAACGSAASSTSAPAKTSSTSPASSSADPAPAAASFRSGSGTPATRAPVVKTHASRYGKILFDRVGRVLYLFASDRTKASTCYGACAGAWPPYTVNRTPHAGAGVASRLLRTTRRRDGRLQVTYAGHPLYYFTGDTAPGQITCQNVSEFGGLWLVVNPSGAAVR